MNENDKTTSRWTESPSNTMWIPPPPMVSSPSGDAQLCDGDGSPMNLEEDGDDFYDGPLIPVANGGGDPVSAEVPVESKPAGGEPPAEIRKEISSGEDVTASDGPEMFPEHGGPELLPDEYDVGMFDATPLKLDEIQRQLAELHKDFQSKIKYDAHKNRIIDELHKELQHYKDDVVKKYIKSLVLDLIQFGDNMRKLVRHFEGRPLTPEDTRKLFNLLETVPSDIDDILYRQGVESFHSDAPLFDATRQRVIGRVDSQRAEDDRRISEAIHPGYDWEGTLIRPELVNVYVFNPNTETSERDDGNEQGS